MNNKELNTIYNKDSSIVSRKIADEFILVPIRHKTEDVDSIYTLNEVGAFIWEQIDGKKRNRDICDALVEQFDVTRKEAETDLSEFIKQLEKVGVVRKS